MLLVLLHSVKVSEVLLDFWNLVKPIDFTFYIKIKHLTNEFIAYSKCLGETVLFIPCCKLVFALCPNRASHAEFPDDVTGLQKEVLSSEGSWHRDDHQNVFLLHFQHLALYADNLAFFSLNARNCV